MKSGFDLGRLSPSERAEWLRASWRSDWARLVALAAKAREPMCRSRPAARPKPVPRSRPAAPPRPAASTDQRREDPT